jgi:HEPN domain-containing protein
MDDPTRDETLAWVAKAEQDLDVARLVQERSGPATVGCFLCQQAIEKLLKALLVWVGETPPRSHDLADLHRRIGGRAGPLRADPAELAAWSPYAVASRYPGFPDPAADADLPAMLAFALDLDSHVRSLIQGS